MTKQVDGWSWQPVFAVLFASLFVVKAIAGQTAEDVVGRTWITDVTIGTGDAGENFAQIDEDFVFWGMAEGLQSGNA